MKTVTTAWLTLSLLLGMLTSGISSAKTTLQSRSVTGSKYYTGQTGKAKLDYISLNDWLIHRANDNLPKDIYDRGFIIDKPAVLKPLYDITNRLLENWPGTVPPIAIFIRADTKSSTYGAEALIANEVLIYYGTLINIDSDDELAAIIAHELAHVLLGHNAKANYANIALQLLNDYESVKNLRDTVKAGHVVKTADKQYDLKFEPGLQHDIVKAGEQKRRAAELYYAYHGSLLGRPAETKADLLAADLLIAAGYSPIGLHDTLGKLGNSYTIEKFVSESLSDASEKIMGAVKTSVDEQIDGFKNQLENAAINGSVDFSNMLSKDSLSTFTHGVSERLKTAAVEFAWKKFKTSHPAPEKRVTKLVDYLDKNYGVRQRLKRKSTTLLTPYRRHAINSLQDYKKLELASLKLIEGNIDQAAKQSIASLHSGNDKDPYKRYTAHRIRRDQNKIGSAITNIERIENINSIPTYALVEMLDLLIENQRFTTADQMIERKEQYGYTITPLYPAKIALALGHKKTEQATQLASSCIADKTIKKDIKNQCIAYGLLDTASATGNNPLSNSLKSATSVFTNMLNPLKK